MPVNSNIPKAHDAPAPTIFVNRFFYPDHSASSQILSDVAFSLANEGYPVQVFSSQIYYQGGNYRLPQRENLHGVEIYRIRTTDFGRTNNFGRSLDYLSFLISLPFSLLLRVPRGATIVCKTDPPFLSILCAVIAKLKGARLVNWLQDLFPETAAAAKFRLARGLPGKILRWLRNASLKAADCNVVIGEEEMANRLLSEGIDPNTIRLIPNHADTEEIKPVDPNRNALRLAWGLQDKFVIGYSGNLGYAHDYETILEAATRLRDNAEVCFLFIGGGKYIPYLAGEVRRRKLSNVLFKPYQPRTELCLSLSVPDVHLVTLTPEFEGFIVPSKIYGIAAAGRPTLNIGAPDGEIGRLISKWQCGVSVDPGDVSGCLKAIANWMADPEQRARQGARARQGIGKPHSKKNSIDKWRSVLEATTSTPFKTLDKDPVEANVTKQMP